MSTSPFTLLRKAYGDAMRFFDDQYLEFQNKIKYKPLMKLVIENRRMELINKVSKYFKDDVITQNVFAAILRDIQDIEEKTTQDLKHLYQL